jgi:hypothetical protein
MAGDLLMGGYDPAADPVHGSGWNSAARWGGWDWRRPRRGEHFRTCSFCGSIHPEDLAAETAGNGVCQVCGRESWDACFRHQGHAGIKDAVRAGDPEVSDEERGRVLAMADEHQYAPGGWWASWADRKYGWPHKFYVEGLVPRDAKMLHYTGSSHNSDEPPSWGGAHAVWVRADRLTRAQCKILKEDGALLPEDKTARFGGDPDAARSWYCLAPRVTLHAKFYTIHLADPAVRQDAKDAIQRASGLRFTFTDDGRVGWERWAA